MYFLYHCKNKFVVSKYEKVQFKLDLPGRLTTCKCLLGSSSDWLSRKVPLDGMCFWRMLIAAPCDRYTRLIGFICESTSSCAGWTATACCCWGTRMNSTLCGERTMGRAPKPALPPLKLVLVRKPLPPPPPPPREPTLPPPREPILPPPPPSAVMNPPFENAPLSTKPASFERPPTTSPLP